MPTHPVIVSLTTIPARNGTLGPTLASLLRQTVKPTEIRVYLTPGCTKPAESAKVRCFEVMDLGPVTKLSPVADPELPPDTLIVTCDDDVLYESAWLHKLVSRAEGFPNDAVGIRGWNASDFVANPKSGKFVPQRFPHHCDVLEGYAGVGYRKRFFDPHPTQPHVLHDMNLATPLRLIDDVWISGILAHRGITRRIVSDKKLCRAIGKHPGIHDRPDFVELNRTAARYAFWDFYQTAARP